MPGHSDIGGLDIPGLLALVITLAVVFAPLLLSRKPSDPGEDSDEGPSGPGGPPGPPPGGPPPGGPPLDDADASRVRLRTHERLADLARPRRFRRSHRPAREPARRVRA